MHITQWGEYGIHCSAFIAQRRKAGQETVRATEIAEAQKIPVDYAQQILQRLRKNGIVHSVRGPQGGYKLGKEPQEINLYDILVASEGDTFEVICDHKPLSLECCNPSTNCNLRPIWYGLRQQVNEYLSRFTLEMLLSGELGIELSEDKTVRINPSAARRSPTKETSDTAANSGS
ncbi:MAG: Rrf2 family transcriptional regulator [Oligoflexia bacterium]|nr:Rrf2 family transcriptional regulator [Oligoflexia bacterium]